MKHTLHVRLAVATSPLSKLTENAMVIESAGAYQRLAGVLERMAPNNREKTLALDALENSFLWVQRSISAHAEAVQGQEEAE